MPYDLRFLAGHNGANFYVLDREVVYIALSMQATEEEQKEVVHNLLPARMTTKGYQRYSSLQFHPQQWDGLLTDLGPGVEAVELQRMGNIVRSLMGQNGPEALAAVLAEMNSLQAGAAASSGPQ